jgi:hypothetical protein
MPSPHTNNLPLLDPSQPTLEIASYPALENGSSQALEDAKANDMESIAGWLINASTLESTCPSFFFLHSYSMGNLATQIHTFLVSNTDQECSVFLSLSTLDARSSACLVIRKGKSATIGRHQTWYMSLS